MRRDNQRKSNSNRNRRNRKRNPNSPSSKTEENKLSPATQASASIESKLETSINETTTEAAVTNAASAEAHAESISESTDANNVETTATTTVTASSENQTTPDTETSSNTISETKSVTNSAAAITQQEVKAAETASKTDTSTKAKQGEKKTMSTTNSSSEKTEAKKANKTSETAPVATPPPQKSGSGFATTLAFFAFILSVAAGGGIYWMWQQLLIERNASSESIATLQQQLETEMRKSQEAIKSEVSQSQNSFKQEVTQVQQEIKQALDSKAQELQTIAQQVETSTEEKISKAQENLTKAQAELGKANHGILETQKRQQSLEVSIEGIYSRLGNTSSEWVIAETDYLLKVANHRLQLEQDVTTAIQALSLADKRLQSLDDPAFNEVRNIIAQELVSLQTLPIPDQSGIAMQLTELQDQVDQLPLGARTQPTHKDTPAFTAEDAPQLEGWSAVPGAVMDTLKGLVVVSYNDKPVEPLLSPEQIRNLHENLKLKLEQARIVLFRGDQEEYNNNMQLAIDWTQKHFNAEEVSTKKFIDTLNYLKEKQVQLKVPDISSSLRSLRNTSKRMELNIPSMENAKSGDNSANIAMN